MSSKIKLSIIVFFSTLIVSIFICWLGGYDFNHRGPQVAIGAVTCIVLSVWAAWSVLIFK